MTKTKNQIAKAFIELLNENPYDKIAIQDITSKAGINRQTFYYHFEDIADLIRFLLQGVIDQILIGNDSIERWESGYLALFNRMKDNKDALEAILSNGYYAKIAVDFLDPLFEKIISEAVIKFLKKNGLTTDTKNIEFLARYYKYPFLGILLDWVGHHFKESPEYLVSNLKKVINGSLINAIQNYNK